MSIRTRFLSATILSALVFASSPEMARAFYPDATPNYATFGCLTCHNNASGGSGCGSPPCLNSFGVAFANNGRVWNYNLATQDSDGDGFSNGRELLDYWGAWRPGNPNPGNAGYATYPGFYTTAMSECSIGAYSVNGWYYDYALCDAVAYCGEQNGAYPGYTCTCPSGYVAGGNPSGSTCTDINECSPSNPCGVGTCQNLAGGFTCTCPDGYAFNGSTCAQDACARNIDGCDAGTVCIPNPSDANAYTCQCASGYQDLVANCVEYSCGTWFCFCVRYSQTCSNIDECTTNSPPCPATSACVDSVGSHTCTPCGANAHVVGAVNAESCVCDAGYQGDPYAGCGDVDECLGMNGCAAGISDCTNTPGGYTCACRPGYDGDGFTCVDIDECATATDECHADATCTDADGTYSCACDPGYFGDGRVCLDVNECQTVSCGAGKACVNDPGAYHCDCAPGYVSDGSGGCLGGCGNGVLSIPERCDDGNMAAGDGCGPNCAVERGYACRESPAGLSTCMVTCGNGRIDPPHEECDDAASNSDSTPGACRTTCLRAHCGDGVVDQGESCDQGASNSSTEPNACRTTCVPAFCGDGVVDASEVCDPGGASALDATVCANPNCVPADAGPGGRRSRGGCATTPGVDARFAPFALALLVAVLARRRARTGR